MKNQLVPVEIMTVRELALFLKASEAKVYRMARMGEVPAFRIGKSWRFKRKAIDHWIREKTNAECETVFNSSNELIEKLS